MKSNLIIIGSFLLLISAASAYEKVYLQQSTPLSRQVIYRPVYNPYSNVYTSPSAYTRANINNIRRIQRMMLLRRMNNKLRRNGFITWNIRNAKGALTGYSTPISQDIYKQMGISPYDTKQKSNSPTCNTDLYGAPNGSETRYSDGTRVRDLGGVSGKTGVTIIYD